MKHSCLYKILVVVFLTTVFVTNAQTVKELENQRKKTLQQLQTTNKMLNETQRSQKSSQNKLNILSQNIKTRKKLIQDINKEVSSLNNEVTRIQKEMTLLDKDLSKLKDEYARLIQDAYEQRNTQSKLVFVLSAETFDQSYRRLRYLQEYSEYKKFQAKQIQEMQTQLTQKSDSIKTYRQTQASILSEKEKEARNLSKDQEKEKNMLADLNKKEKKLRTDIANQQKKANELNKKIDDLIAAEIKKEQDKKRKALEKSGKTVTKEDLKPENMLTKEEQLINGNFEANKGRLPWPVERGFISGRYGIYQDPVHKYVTRNNKGIYIQTPINAEARAVFEGEVVGVSLIMGGNYYALIKHGIYRTVYTNLSEVYVKAGDKVKAKQRIGKIYTDDNDDNKTELQFQIRKNADIVDPTPWLTK